MSILFDKWKTLSSLEEALEEQQQYIQEEKEKKRTPSMDSIKKLKEDMKKHQQEINENPLGKTKSDESEEELWNAQREETSISGGFDSFSQMKKLLFQEKKKISTAARIKQLQVEIGCLEDEIWTLKLLQLEEAKANENNVETPNPQY